MMGERLQKIVLLTFVWYAHFYCQLFNVDYSSVKIINGNCYENTPYRYLIGITFPACITECKLRKRCLYIKYNEGIKYCGFIEESSLIIMKEQQVSMCMYIDVSSIDNQIFGTSLGKCIETPCGENERCSVIGSGYECIGSECPSAPAIQHGTVMSNIRVTGYSTTYLCSWPLHLHGSGDGFILCQTDGKWSKPGKACVETCPQPISQLTNAVLIRTSNPSLTAGTELTYECREGFDGLSKTDNILCLAGGHWNRLLVRCCRIGYQLFDDTCLVHRRANMTVNTYDAMVESCKGDGASLASYTRDLIDFIDQHYPGNSFIIFGDKKDKFVYASLDTLDQACLDNIATVLPRFINLATASADYVIQMGRIATPPCAFTAKWHEGEPNGGLKEQCLASAGDYHFSLLDYVCDFTEQLDFDIRYICQGGYSIQDT